MTGLNERITELFLDGKAGELAALYAPDALVDISVPEWRFQMLGRDVEQRLRGEFEVDGRVITAHRVTPFDGGVVIEMQVEYTVDGEAKRVRDVTIFHTNGEQIVEHTNYCTGVWDTATIARQAIEAPMVRP